MSNMYSNMYRESSIPQTSSSFNTLDRELSMRNEQPFRSTTSRPLSRQVSARPLSGRELSSISETNNRVIGSEKIKYITTDRNNFNDFYSFANRSGQNYNTNQESELLFGDSARRKSVKSTRNVSEVNLRNVDNRSKSMSVPMNKTDRFITNLVKTENDLKINQERGYPSMSINSNEIDYRYTAAKIPKESEEYWDNTKRRNLDTSIYTNNPMKIQGRGFGNIDRYDLFLNGVGLATRQDNPDNKPQNIEDDRIFLTNHNFHYDKYHVPDSLPCGADTRYLNKNMI